MRLISFLFLAVIITSCGETPYYKDELKFQTKVWSYDDKRDFKIDISDTTSTYEMQLVLEHKPNYRFQNIYFKIFTDFPSLKDREELLNIDLASKAGQWVGNCGRGTCKTKVFLLESFRFPEPGQYRFAFEQYTRVEKLEGISSLQLLLYKREEDEKE